MSADSILYIDNLEQQQTNGFVLTWQSIPGEWYRIERTTNLLGGVWANITPSLIQGSESGMNSCAIGVDAANAAYLRVRNQ